MTLRCGYMDTGLGGVFEAELHLWVHLKIGNDVVEMLDQIAEITPERRDPVDYGCNGIGSCV